MADVLKAIILHSCWHRCKDKLHRHFSCCVILIPGRTSTGWHSSTFPGATWQGTSKGIWLPEQHREWPTQHNPMELLVFSQHIKSCLERTKPHVFAGRAFFVTLSEPCAETNGVPPKSQPSTRESPQYLGQEKLADDYTVLRETAIN